MASPQLTSEQVQQLSASVAHHISSQREAFLRESTPLTTAQRLAMEGFFPTETLDVGRVVVLQNRRVQNPDFYPSLEQLGFTNLPDFRMMAATTFNDVVVAHQPFTHGLLFHEFVHVEQYRQLGVSQFSNLYVRGFITGGGYEGIPLEWNAYALGARFEANPQQRFSVAEDVAEWVRQGKF